MGWLAVSDSRYAAVGVRQRAGAHGCAAHGCATRRRAHGHVHADCRAGSETHADSPSNRNAGSHAVPHEHADCHVNADSNTGAGAHAHPHPCANAYAAPDCDAEAPRR